MSDEDPLCLLIDVGCMECVWDKAEAVDVIAACRASDADAVVESWITAQDMGDVYYRSLPSWTPYKHGWLRAGSQGGFYLLRIPSVAT